ncbi:MAG: phenylacetate--CoA ligase family protein [Acidobacteria bacterium]|nr:phenylacetate--CoA ligase family protein [Acidobacteriota bacterium]
MTIGDRLEARLRRHVVSRAGARWARMESTVAVAAIARQERAIPYWPLDRIRALQQQRLRTLVVHARDTVPFYRHALRERGVDVGDVRTEADLARLPAIDGTTLARDPMPFVSEPFVAEGREVFKTSGSSSGLRKPVFWDYPSLLLRPARGERDRVVIARLAEEPWTDVIVREFLTTEWRHSLARWGGVRTQGHQRLLILPSDFSSRTQRAIYSERTVIPQRPVHYHHLPPSAPFEVAAAHLRAIRPRVVFSFGSYVDQFLHFLDASGGDVPMPRVWVYLGDRISPGGRELADTLGCRLYSVYSAMEAGTIGFQCERRQGFHLNIDLCAVRIVDDDGRQVPDGETGDIVISPLDNRAMVLLNYRVGDRGAIAREPCACGRTLPLLERMDGRRSEIIRLADGRELSSLAIEAAFSAELRRTVQAQLEQVADGHLRWRVVPYRGVEHDQVRAALVARGRYALGADTRLDVEILDEIPRTSAGKFVRVRTSPIAPVGPGDGR